MRKCPGCGEENPERARFCFACGTALDVAAPERRRLATLLFCDMSGSTAMGERVDAESVRDLTFRYFAEMRQAIERHGGTVEKFIGDAVMAVFGVPTAHEDDAVRAVRAAAEMQARLSDLNTELASRYGSTIALRIGVNTGEVVAGDATSRQALVTGDAVNVAARLEQAARPGEVLLGATTYRLVRHAVTAEPVEPVQAKGKSQPLTAYRLVDVAANTPPRRRRHTPLVGRELDLHGLEQAFAEAVRARACRLVTVLGEPGVGKSRVADELVERVSTRATVLRGACLSYGEGITFWPFGEIVRVAAGVLDDDAPDRARARIAALLPSTSDGQRIANRVSQAIGLIGGSAPAEEITWAIRKLLEAFAQRRPLLVVVDDVHWAEPALLDLLAALPSLVLNAPILVVCLARPELLEDRAEWTPLLRLEPLDRAQSGRLVETLIGAAELAPGVRARIAAVAGGNALFAEELVASFLERGAQRHDGQSDAADDDVDDLDMPPTIGALLGARLDRLPQTVRATLERGAVEGEQFHHGALLALTQDAERDAVGDALAALQAKNLIHSAPSTFSVDVAFRFRHLLIREAAYDAVPKKLRAQLHERFGHWLQAAAGDRLAEFEEILAYHLERAVRYAEELGPIDADGRELARQAGEHLAAAGRRALDRSDMPAAANLLSRATSLLPPDTDLRREILVDLASAVRAVGHLARADELLSEAIEVTRSTHDTRTQWRAIVARAAVQGDLGGDFTTQLAAAEEAIGALTAIGDDLGLARAWHLIGQLRFWMGPVGTAADAWDTALAHARRAHSQPEESEILTWILICSWFGPEPIDQGIGRCQEILRTDTYDRKTTAQALVENAVFLAARGEFDEARRRLAKGRAIIDELGLTLLSGIVSEEAFDVEMLAGDVIAAEHEARRGCELLERMGERNFLATRLGCLAQALYAQGRYDEADELTNRLENEGPVDDLDVQTQWRALRAKLLARQGQNSAAQALAAEATRLLRTTDWLNWQGDRLLDQCEVLALTDRPDLAARVAREALALYERKGNVVSARRAAATVDRLEVDPRTFAP